MAPSPLPAPLPSSLYGGSMADLKTYQISGVLAYDVTPNVRSFRRRPRPAARGQGRRLLREQLFGQGRNKWGYGYLLGAAYERPEIALRVALTYYSKVSYDLSPRRRSPFFTGTVDRGHQHRRRHAAVGAARLPDRHRREDAGLRLYPLGGLVGVRDRPAGLRGADGGAPRRGTPAHGLRRRLVDLQPRHRPAAHRALAGSFSITYEPASAAS